MGLAFVRFLVKLKPLFLRVLHVLQIPFVFLAHVLISIILPVYRFFYMLKKRLEVIYLPAKNRLMFWLTNRFIVHAVVGALVIGTVFLNIRADAVRAESFGQDSLMYQLVASENARVFEEVIDFEDGTVRAAHRYAPTTAIASTTFGQDPTALTSVRTSLFGGSSLTAATQNTSSGSVAPRTEIISYTVQTGDTLSSIASDFGISNNTLFWANNLNARSTIRPGKELIILPVSGVSHKVVSGDTLSRIAGKYDASEDDILDFNRLSDSSQIAVGDELIIPGGTIKSTPPSKPAVIGTAPTVPTTPTNTGSAVGTGTMVWPTDLRVITQYYGWAHTGIDIDCHFTHNNYAADAGVVTYAGWKGGYGYTVEIDHGNGLYTRYGHHASLFVQSGQTVSRGQALGICGTTGRSTGTHLHFEVHAGNWGNYRNPLSYVR